MGCARTYSLLPVSRATFTDISRKLAEAGVLEDYLDEKEGVIVFGTVAVRMETGFDRSARN